MILLRLLQRYPILNAQRCYPYGVQSIYFRTGVTIIMARFAARRSFWTARGLKRSGSRMVWGGTAGGGLSCSAAERSGVTADARASASPVPAGAPSPLSAGVGDGVRGKGGIAALRGVLLRGWRVCGRSAIRPVLDGTTGVGGSGSAAGCSGLTTESSDCTVSRGGDTS